jgi:tellurite resistance protein
MLNLIIFGTRGVTYSHETGDFWCPSCRSEQPFNHKRVRRFFTLYFIPLIPLDLLGEYIECVSCADTYNLEVLQLTAGGGGPDVEFEAEFHRAVRRVMVLMMLADGVIDDEEVATICEIYGRLAETELTPAKVREEASDAQREGLDVHTYLKSLVGSLNDSGKEMVVKAAFFVAAADGNVSPEERQLLDEIGKALEMSTAHFRGVVAELAEP